MLMLMFTFSLVNVLYRYILSLRLLIESNVLLNITNFVDFIVNDVINTTTSSNNKNILIIHIFITIIFIS